MSVFELKNVTVLYATYGIILFSVGNQHQVGRVSVRCFGQLKIHTCCLLWLGILECADPIENLGRSQTSICCVDILILSTPHMK